MIYDDEMKMNPEVVIEPILNSYGLLNSTAIKPNKKSASTKKWLQPKKTHAVKLIENPEKYKFIFEHFGFKDYYENKVVNYKW